jgi:hypothetical protein
MSASLIMVLSLVFAVIALFVVMFFFDDRSKSSQKKSK